VDPEARITRVRGQGFERSGAKILPTFHPAAVLRDRTKLKPVAEDFKKLAAARRMLEEARSGREKAVTQAEQMALDFSGGGQSNAGKPEGRGLA